ncbi:MAG: M48 family metallopeptidase [Candidatus Micrarchaeaceae archaeon]
MQDKIEVAGRIFEVVLLRKTGISATASVSGNQIRIRVPAFLSEEESNALFNELKQKIIRKIVKKLNENPRALSLHERELNFYDGQVISVFGKRFVIRVKESRNRASTANILGNEIHVALAEGLSVDERNKHLSSLCIRAISHAILPELTRRVKQVNSRSFGFKFNKVSVTYSRTKWGSCNARKRRVNLNFLLLFAPDSVLDYVIVHELAHLKEHNHSSAFWSLVSSAMPNYKSARLWLRKNGYTLTSIS